VSFIKKENPISVIARLLYISFASIDPATQEAILRTLVVDNYDSFTFNLVHLLAEANQEEPLVIRNDELSWPDVAALDFDNIVISPGPGRPERPSDFGLSADAITRSSVPVLGVCLGHQGIAALHGGVVTAAPAPMHGRMSQIRHSGDELFTGLASPFWAVRYHSLIVGRPLPAPLIETAWTEDGLIMGLRHRQRPIWGVQFHPESILTEFGLRLIVNFRDVTHRLAAPRRRALKPTALSAHRRCSTTSTPPGRAYWRELPIAIDTEAGFCDLYASTSTSFWLDSSLIAGGNRWSFLGDAAGPNAATVSYDMRRHRLTICNSAGRRIEKGDIFTYLERNRAKAPIFEPPCPFVGGHIGWFGYDLRGDCKADVARSASTPSAFFIKADRFIAVDHLAQRTYVVAIDNGQAAVAAQDWVNATVARLYRLPAAEEPRLGHRGAPIRFKLHRDQAAYLADIEHCLDWIFQGETYQVCLTNELVCNLELDWLDLYRVMRRINPAPHAAFLRWSGGAILSASPERFLSVDRVGQVEAKPIKGTAARAVDPVLDRALAEILRTSEKDRAENLMIVDLLRNDLSRVCKFGSVNVPSLFAIETYATVHQLVSTVRGLLREEATTLDLVRAAFPGGSMTGAPKCRTLQFIDRLERRARGIYAGALGWLSDDGAADLSIVIRTIVATGKRLSIGVGGGIVAQSNPQAEFEEMLLKSMASVRAIATAATGKFNADDCYIDGVDLGSIHKRLKQKQR
jgi:para-aminobenzoate synthetase